MAVTSPYQSKRKRLVFASETSAGVGQELIASAFEVPAMDISLARDRGTQVIKRDGVMDGEAGAQCGVPGSFGSSLSFTSELHSVAGGDNYFIRLLQACGMSGSDSGTVMTMTPSAETIQDYAVTSPNSLTFGLIHKIEGIDDTLQMLTASTGVASFTLAPGERVAAEFAFVGINGDFIDLNTNYDLTGSSTGLTCLPFVCQEMTAVLTNTSAPTNMDEVELGSITIATNAETPDVLDPTQANGFALSPVFWNVAPTVSFTIAATAINNQVFWQRFRDGETISMVLTLSDVATARQIVITLSKVQFTGISMADNGGKETYSVEGDVVRAVGTTYATAGNLFSIAYTY